jgi:tetratricopeptide (TPR) repeat protein
MSAHAAGQEELRAQVRRIDGLLRERRGSEARPLCEALVAAEPGNATGWILLARAREQAMDFAGMLEAARRARGIAPGATLAAFVEAEALLHCGQVREARAALAAIESAGRADFDCLRRLTGLHFQMNQQHDAARCAGAALALRPDDLGALQGVASAKITLGALDEAEQLLDEVIRRAPGDGGAYYNRATLRRQTAERNHVQELRRALAAVRDPVARVPLGFALAKELEDLGDWEASFAELRQAADTRRRQLSYRVEADTAAMEEIRRAFDGGWAHGLRPGFADARPILVLGLPRSGTTLVERILGRHPDVASLGEVNAFAFAVMRLGAPAAGKEELIRKSARIEPALLGRDYWTALTGYGREAPRLIDKTPLNFLYLGLMAAAMPQARFVHLRRHPLASCYAMYKTLFQSGYPFSYDLSDLGRYYLAYDRLMQHWRELLPGRVLDLDYEALVDDAEGMTRRLLEWCGLSWHEACLRFHEDPSPSATASAAQVRRPIYRESRDLWRRYERQLQPLARMLEAGGVPVR